jgi:hypothetical protein
VEEEEEGRSGLVGLDHLFWFLLLANLISLFFLRAERKEKLFFYVL